MTFKQFNNLVNALQFDMVGGKDGSISQIDQGASRTPADS